VNVAAVPGGRKAGNHEDGVVVLVDCKESSTAARVVAESGRKNFFGTARLLADTASLLASPRTDMVAAQEAVEAAGLKLVAPADRNVLTAVIRNVLTAVIRIVGSKQAMDSTVARCQAAVD